MKERYKAVPAVYLLLVKDGEILLGLRQNTGYMDGKWQVPAGHVEKGEMPMEALIREVEEEIGINILPQDLKLVHTSYRPEHDPTGARANYFFSCYEWSGEVVNAEPLKCVELKWCEPNKLPDNTTPHVRHAIECALRGELYSELGYEWIKSKGLYQLESSHMGKNEGIWRDPTDSDWEEVMSLPWQPGMTARGKKTPRWVMLQMVQAIKDKDRESLRKFEVKSGWAGRRSVTYGAKVRSSVNSFFRTHGDRYRLYREGHRTLLKVRS